MGGVEAEKRHRSEKGCGSRPAGRPELSMGVAVSSDTWRVPHAPPRCS